MPEICPIPPQEFERQRGELVQKKARAAERAAREARRIAAMPVIADYARATRSRTKVNYAEVSSTRQQCDLAGADLFA